MIGLRRALVPLAVVWLSCRIGTAAVVSVALSIVAADPHAAAECTCGHGAGAICPMHRHKPAGDPNSDCTMQAAKQTGAAVLTTIVGATGLIPEPTPSLVAPVPSIDVSSADAAVRGERPVPPDPPPPRA